MSCATAPTRPPRRKQRSSAGSRAESGCRRDRRPDCRRADRAAQDQRHPVEEDHARRGRQAQVGRLRVPADGGHGSPQPHEWRRSCRCAGRLPERHGQQDGARAGLHGRCRGRRVPGGLQEAARRLRRRHPDHHPHTRQLRLLQGAWLGADRPRHQGHARGRRGQARRAGRTRGRAALPDPRL